ncbi:UTP--glucose-1-phosphate uridylyltransferase, partial [Patescibacteria group bacterium]|nr:UTP--glucose-1-phosphate uridylyltransferase [Patescibacteria group bacterium]
ADSDISQVVFIVPEDNKAILEYFKPKPKIENILKKRGNKALLAKLKKTEKDFEKISFTAAVQKEPKGDGHAVLQAKDAVGNEPFLVLFGDDIVKGDIPAAKQLIDSFAGEVVMAVEQVPKDSISSYGVIEPGQQRGRLYEIKGLVEKPSADEAPSDLGIIGKYVCPPEIFEALENSTHGQDGEIRLIDGFIKLGESQKLWAYNIEGERFDTGKAKGLVAANNAFLSIKN